MAATRKVRGQGFLENAAVVGATLVLARVTGNGANAPEPIVLENVGDAFDLARGVAVPQEVATGRE